MSRSKFNLKEIYDAVVADNAQTHVAELAKRFGLKAPLLTHYVLIYADEHQLDIPRFCYVRKKPDIVIKKLQRSRDDRDWRISALQSSKSGQSGVLNARIFGVPSHRFIALIPDDLELTTVEELIAYLQGPGTRVNNADVATGKPEVASETASKAGRSKGITERDKSKRATADTISKPKMRKPRSRSVEG